MNKEGNDDGTSMDWSQISILIETIMFYMRLLRGLLGQLT